MTISKASSLIPFLYETFTGDTPENRLKQGFSALAQQAQGGQFGIPDALQFASQNPDMADFALKFAQQQQEQALEKQKQAQKQQALSGVVGAFNQNPQSAVGDIGPQIPVSEQQVNSQRMQALMQLAGINPELAKTVEGFAPKDAIPFEGTGLDQKSANLKYLEYKAQGYSDFEAQKMAADDVRSSETQLVRTPEGDLIEFRQQRLFSPQQQQQMQPNLQTPQQSIETQIPGARVVAPAPIKQESLEVYDEFVGGLEGIQKLRQAVQGDPSVAGTVGAIRGAGETTLGALSDVMQYLKMPGAEFVRSAQENLGRSDISDTLRSLAPIENSLAYSLARARKGGASKLNLQDVENAKKDVNLQGLGSARQVEEKLGAVEGEIQSSFERFLKRNPRLNQQTPKSLKQGDDGIWRVQ